MREVILFAILGRGVGSIYALTSLRKLKHSLHTAGGRDDYWQAGRSVAAIKDVVPVAEVIRRMTA